MHDLTTGSLSRHLLKTTSFMLVSMVFQTMYFLIDLYWVGRLGTDSVAAVAIAGNWSFFVLALTQMLGVGTTAVIAHAVGRKSHDEAKLLFNQSQVLALVIGVLFLIAGLIVRMPYVRAMSPDAATERQAGEYLLWFVPAMALQFGLVSMGAALRAVGNFKPTMIVSSVTVAINIVLAPFLIFGWGTGHAFGVAGAAISSLISIAIGTAWMTRWFLPHESYLRFDFSMWKPRAGAWKKMLTIGMPTGAEFALMTLYLVIVYAIARPFGAAAQAGFGIGGRVIQAGFMPVIALGFAVAPVAGQNFGARLGDRVRRTFRDAALMSTGLMILFTIVCHIVPAELIRIFSDDPAVIATGVEYLRIISYNYVASGLIFVSASMFQAMGNTLPSLAASFLRIVIVAIPAVMMSRMQGFTLTWIWYLSVFAVWVQLLTSLYLLRRELAKRLSFPAEPSLPPSVPVAA